MQKQYYVVPFRIWQMKVYFKQYTGYYKLGRPIVMKTITQQQRNSMTAIRKKQKHLTQ